MSKAKIISATIALMSNSIISIHVDTSYFWISWVFEVAFRCMWTYLIYLLIVLAVKEYRKLSKS